MATELDPHICRDSTIRSHRQAVERVILTMRGRFDEPMALHDMADVACLSAFHFDRIFRQMTGIPPVQFLYALRIEAAKRLLLTTSLSVTDVCYEVGYNSLGTFTSRFTQLVGLSPRQFRHLAATVKDSRLESLVYQAATIFKRTSLRPFVTGRIIVPERTQRMIFVGLFPGLIPQGHPVAGTLLTTSQSYRIGPVKDGRYHVFAAAFPKVNMLQTYLLPDASSLLVGVGAKPAIVQENQAGDCVNVRLRPLRITDPPILIALPFLLNEALKQS